MEITVTIKGFKTIEEAKNWTMSYQEGVEQDMSLWSEEHGNFPWMSDTSTEEGNNITINLMHPDNYGD